VVILDSLLMGACAKFGERQDIHVGSR
jgi:hypothetical protein